MIHQLFMYLCTNMNRQSKSERLGADFGGLADPDFPALPSTTSIAPSCVTPISGPLLLDTVGLTTPV